jgi:hypothetical protein
LMAGRSHVAVLSFLRYHPHVKMSPAQHLWREWICLQTVVVFIFLNPTQSLNL